ncbi:MAG TPA: TolC family protein [Verrucomicrobiota bacterium]|nr:TolC family protein [Verrucomicrobiota bacterium]
MFPMTTGRASREWVFSGTKDCFRVRRGRTGWCDSSRLWVLTWFALVIGVGVCRSGTPTAAAVSTNAMPLAVLRQLVVHRNESIQIKALEYEISRKAHAAERGIFEPAVVASIEHVDSQRPNNSQQYASLGLYSVPELDERNTIYDGGLEFLVPSGARLKAGVTLRELNNNLQPLRKVGTEYESFAGARLVQPLLKNFGPGPTLARIRLAAVASEIAFQEYRRQLILSLGQAESGYWDLYLAQEQERLTAESVGIAERLLADNKARVEVGKGSPLEVLQAEAGAAFRRTRMNEARQKVIETATRLGSLYSYVSGGTNALPWAVDAPEVESEEPSLSDSYELAFQFNPDFVVRRCQLEQEKIRVAYTRNQRLPQLDLKASLGLNGLGLSPGESWDELGRGEYPVWSVGVELRVPITGGIRERNEYQAALMAKRKALVGLKEIEVQVYNAVDAAIQKVRLYRDNVASYKAVADFHQKLLEAQLDRLAVGAIDSKTVLETEEKLFEAKVAVVESKVLYKRAQLEHEMICGTLLKARDLETTRELLSARTMARLTEAGYSAPAIEQFKRTALADVNQAMAEGASRK